MNPTPSPTSPPGTGPASPGSEPRELTVRALVVGLGVGCLVGAANVAVGLKIGLAFGATLTCAVVSFALFRVLRFALRQPFSPRENLIASTAGSAAAALASSAGLISFVPAVEALGAHLGYWEVVLWAAPVSVLGVFFALPLRRLWIVREPLPFPTGTANAETITAMFASARSAMGRTRVLLLAALGAFGLTWLFALKPLPLGPYQNLGLDDFGLAGVGLFGVSASALRLGVSCSPLILGAGVLIGPRVGWSLLAGSLLGWGLGAPWLIHSGVVVPAASGKEFAAAFQWLLWPAVSLMVCAGLTGLALQGRVIGRALASLGVGPRSATVDGESGSISLRSWLLGLLAVTGCTMAVAWWLFGITPWMTALAVLLSFVFCAISVRAVGETDVNPSGPMAKITQIAYGLIDPVRVTTNVMTAGITAAGASQAADMMTDLKSGHLLGASVRRQVLAQLLGVGFGTLALVGVYRALAAAYPIPGEEFPGPSVQSWMAVARVLTGGLAAVPPGAPWAALVAGLVGVGLTLLAQVRRLRPWLPSPVALGIALLVPGHYAIGMWLSALVTWWVRRRRPALVESYGAALAGGLMTGEGLATVCVAVALVLGAGWV